MRHVAVVLVSLLGAALAMLLASPPVAAFDPAKAASYADRNWNQCPPGEASGCNVWAGECYRCFSADCTNFVSAAVHEAGYDFHGTIGDNTLHDWYSRGDGVGHVYVSDTWIVADDFYVFLMIDAPGGSLRSQHPGSDTHPLSGGNKGWVYSYDWVMNDPNDPTPIDHAAIQTSRGTDPNSGYYGDLVSQHTTNRHNAFWSLRPYNQYWRTTWIYVVQIDTAN